MSIILQCDKCGSTNNDIDMYNIEAHTKAKIKHLMSTTRFEHLCKECFDEIKEDNPELNLFINSDDEVDYK